MTTKSEITRTGFALMMCVALVVVFGIFNVLFFLRIGDLQNRANILETDKTNLQTWLDGNETLLKTTMIELNQLQTWLDGNATNYESQIQNLNFEMGRLNSQINSLEARIDSLNSKYNNYVAKHHHTDEEYDDAFFSFYYIKPEEQKFGVYSLDGKLDDLEWSEPYQEDVFDCSEMSAYLEWYLENEGWNVIIVLGDAPFGGGYHAWLLVETSTDYYMPVESTTIDIVWWGDPYFDDYFIYDHQFDNIQQALAYYESEFDWWEIL